MDLEALYRKLEFASFSQREQIAGEVAQSTPRDELAPLVRGLDHPHQGVRLGIIEVFRRATYREALRRLLTHAGTYEGDDKVFAIRAIANLAEPGDDFLVEPMKKWIASGDAFIEPHATKLRDILVKSRIRPPEPAAPTKAIEPVREPSAPTNPDSLDKLVVALFTAVKGAERIALVDHIERRGPQALVAAAKIVLAKGNEHLVAYIARALIRQASNLRAPEALIPQLEAARKRLGVAPIANAAIDDALLALGGLALSPALIARVVEMDKAQADALVARLGESEPSEVALHVPVLLDALARRPQLWSSLGPILVYASTHVRESTRAELRRLTDLVIDQARAAKPLPPVTLASATWVLAKIGERGEALPRQLRVALERIAGAEASRALAALCGKLATEEAANAVVSMLRDPLLEAREAARDAVGGWESPWIAIENDQVVPRYEGLVRRGDKLVDPHTAEEYVLDSRGRPTRYGETEWGGCLCCAPPRALIRRRNDVWRCPSTWEGHVRDGGRVVFQRDYVPPPPEQQGQQQPPLAPIVPSEHGRNVDEDALPKPPTRDELEHVAPHIRAAIVSNVFLHARDGDQRWNGSAIIIARDGNHIAMLTNRHVVESDDRQRLCALDAMTVSGEAIRVSCVWRAKKGIDLALVEGRVAKPEDIGVMALGAGVGLVGAEVFAIGNPLGLAWSYTAGTISAIRHWTTQDGQSVRILQTDANIAPGSSGGGLFHSDGHLLGVMSFLRQGYAGGSAHFALSIDAIREAFAREDVRWRGAALADLPK
jgi:S1-C subfamily serine protease